MIKGFFFDLDGTLVDTYEADYLAYKDAIKTVKGVEIEYSDFKKTHGLELRDKLKSIFGTTNEDEIKQIAQEKKNVYSKYLHTTKDNKLLIDFLKNFSNFHTTVLVTTAKKENALKVLNKYNLEDVFDYCVFGEDIEEPKPSPRAYTKALEATNLKASEVIAFEDSDSGVKSAEAAGIAVVKVSRFS